MGRKLTNSIHYQRVLRGISRKELANKIGVHYNTLKKIENGIINPGVKTALLISEVFDMYVNELFNVENHE